MSTAWRTRHRATSRSIHRCRQIRHIADLRPFAAGDLVILRQKLDRSAPPILTRPLERGGRINGHKGVIRHDDIIGKRVRDVVRTAPLRSGKDETEYRLHDVKLEEYVRLSKRLVTPIYPSDANLIVELLDLHVEPYDPDAADGDAPELEILEAGTGHGALTLYLSRAIHVANAPRPRLNGEEDDETRCNAMEAWKHTRRAVVHTIDSSAKYSEHAAKVVKGFKHGMYYDNVDFHVTDVGAWTRKALSERNEKPFLSHAFLDLPKAEIHLGGVARALRTDGCLVVFNPSITQILECVRRIKEEGILLELDNVIELGVNGSSGGREWNVRAVKPRAADRDATRQEALEEEEAETAESSAIGDVNNGEGDLGLDKEDALDEPASNERWSMICRPKVGDRIVGGGFLGVWRKQRDMRNGSLESTRQQMNG